jgi:hypothetical protein
MWRKIGWGFRIKFPVDGMGVRRGVRRSCTIWGRRSRLLLEGVLVLITELLVVFWFGGERRIRFWTWTACLAWEGGEWSLSGALSLRGISPFSLGVFWLAALSHTCRVAGAASSTRNRMKASFLSFQPLLNINSRVENASSRMTPSYFVYSW